RPGRGRYSLSLWRPARVGPHVRKERVLRLAQIIVVRQARARRQLGSGRERNIGEMKDQREQCHVGPVLERPSSAVIGCHLLRAYLTAPVRRLSRLRSRKDARLWRVSQARPVAFSTAESTLIMDQGRRGEHDAG